MPRWPARVARRIPTTTAEWLYVFRPLVVGVRRYVKIVLRRDCVVVSFHDDEGPQEGHEDREEDDR